MAAQRQMRSDDTDKWVWGFGDGRDGDLVISGNTTEAPVDSSCSGNAGDLILAATNASFAPGQFVMIHQTRGTGAGQWELNRIISYTAGAMMLYHPLCYTYTDSGASQAQVRVMKQYNNVTINTGVTYSAKDWDLNVGGIIGWFAKGLTTITGTLESVGATGATTFATLTPVTVGGGFQGGYGRRGTTTTGKGACGEGTAGASAEQSAKNGNGGGAGVGDDKTGGGGGNGAAGSNGSTGVGGDAVGTANLVTMLFGGGGGGGAEYDGSIHAAGAGGSGGGIVFLATKNISITGGINLNGGAGGNGDDKGAGGGGAGGSCLIKSLNAALGTTKITVAAGAGGSSAGSSGGNGGVGRIHLDYSLSYSGTTTATLDLSNDTTLARYQRMAMIL